MIELNVRSAFGAARWTDVTERVPGCTAAFLSSDMLVAVLATSSVAEAAIEYPEVQQAIKRARAELKRQVDAYLLLVVPTVSADVYPDVRAALDDPLICRKVVIELGSEEPSGALRRQFPLLANSDDPQPTKHEGAVSEPNPEDLELLDRNGADNIVELLLARVQTIERDPTQ